jgi:hypothetical protein
MVQYGPFEFSENISRTAQEKVLAGADFGDRGCRGATCFVRNRCR